MKIFFSSGDMIPPLYDGDVLIVNENYRYKFYYYFNKGRKLLESVKSIKWFRDVRSFEVILSYSGMGRRQGNLHFIEFLLTVFSNTNVVSFLRNAMDILLYKEDKWHAVVIQNLIYSELYESMVSSEKKSFSEYLEQKAIVLCQSLFDQGKSKSVVFRMVKDKFPNEFTKAILLFKRDYPERSIYD